MIIKPILIWIRTANRFLCNYTCNRYISNNCKVKKWINIRCCILGKQYFSSKKIMRVSKIWCLKWMQVWRNCFKIKRDRWFKHSLDRSIWRRYQCRWSFLYFFFDFIDKENVRIGSFSIVKLVDCVNYLSNLY